MKLVQSRKIFLTEKMLNLKKYCIPILALVILSMLLGTVVLNKPASASPPLQPMLEIRISLRTVQIDGEYTDFWFYVTNPSRVMERELVEDPPGTPVPPYWEILHPVKINYLTGIVVEPDGNTYEFTIFPPEDKDDYEDGWLKYRWNVYNRGEFFKGVLVYPGETSLVFYHGQQYQEGAISGVYRFTYKLTVTFEEETFDLVKSFQIFVKPAQ